MEEKERRKWRRLVGDIVSEWFYDPSVQAPVLWLRGLSVRDSLRETREWLVEATKAERDCGQGVAGAVTQLATMAAFNVPQPEAPESVTNFIADIIAAAAYSPMDAKDLLVRWSLPALQVGFANRVWHASDRGRLFGGDFPAYFTEANWTGGRLSVVRANDLAVGLAVQRSVVCAIQDGTLPVTEILLEHGFDVLSKDDAEGDVSGERVAETLRACQKLGMRRGPELLKRYDAQTRPWAVDAASAQFGE